VCAAAGAHDLRCSAAEITEGFYSTTLANLTGNLDLSEREKCGALLDSRLKGSEAADWLLCFCQADWLGQNAAREKPPRIHLWRCRCLAQIYMSEYTGIHNVSRLIGAPPGYVGYEEGVQLTERIRGRSYAVVFLRRAVENFVEDPLLE
jgi:hypothetical protein